MHEAALGVPSALVPAPVVAQIESLPLVEVPVPPLGTTSVDLRPALRELLQPLPDVELLRVGAATASATGRCVAGDPIISGASSISGAVLAGQPVDIDGPRSDVVELLGAYAIDPSDIDRADVVQHGSSLTPAVLGPLLQPILDVMAPIPVPATLAGVQLVPDERVQAGSRWTYRALHVRASVAGTEIIDAVLAEASAGGDDCAAGSGAAGAATLADLALQCASQQVVLIDVLNTGRKVKLVGAAAGRYVGREVEIRLAGTARVVARPIVGEDGTFRATAPLPARRIRHTNAARYRASIDGERSLPLKLSRRMIVSKTTSTARGTTMRGRVTGPLTRRAFIVVKRRVVLHAVEDGQALRDAPQRALPHHDPARPRRDVGRVPDAHYGGRERRAQRQEAHVHAAAVRGAPLTQAWPTAVGACRRSRAVNVALTSC